MVNRQRTRDTSIGALVAMIQSLPRRPDVWVRASENSEHVGALLADAALQPGLNYTVVVEPRVRRVFHDHPAAATISGVSALLVSRSAEDILGVKNARKCAVFRELVCLLHADGVETSRELRDWLEQPESRSKLLEIKGIGYKTAAYLRLLLGLPAIAIDVHLRRAAEAVGVVGSDEYLEELFTLAAENANIPLREVDGMLWQAGADGARGRAT